ncbi:RNA polymerase sigma factor [Flagellimonas baculiformis]|uniref:RNA polymerase sigma factor n=1 Tax=Flagellimonas baculiformis TaxID=3067310 RepID=UPI00296F3E62|nr:RNA polymerase sigma-70 factor [Muricauda sp. D6]
MDEKIKVEAIQKGDRKAFKTVIESYYNEIYWYAKSLSRNEALAKDLVQEAFFKLWKKRDNIKKGTILKGWLYKSVRNNFLDHIKKYKKETYFFETTYAETLDHVIEREYQEDLKHKVELVEKEIEQLPKKCNQVFKLSKKEGLTNTEIAEHLGISIKTVEGHLTKALKILREKLKEKIKVLFLILGHVR